MGKKEWSRFGAALFDRRGTVERNRYKLDNNLMEEQKADYQFYIAKGSHHQIGLITANHAAGLIETNNELNHEQRKFAEQCRTIVQRIYPEIIDEFNGYAEGLNLKEENLLWQYTLGVKGGCSGIAIRTPKGMFVGRNYDFFYWENRRHLIFTQPDNGFSHIGIHEGLVGGRFDGLNEKGLYISFNGAGQHPDPTSPGLSFHLIVRYILEKCSNAFEAKEALMLLPIKEPKSYLVVDKKDAFVVEAHLMKREVRQMNNDFLIATNHFKHPSMTQYQREWPNSVSRFKKLEDSVSLLMNNTKNPTDILKQVLADHEAPICGHDDGLATFWSCIANMENLEILYSLGAPCRNEYKEYFKF